MRSSGPALPGNCLKNFQIATRERSSKKLPALSLLLLLLFFVSAYISLTSCHDALTACEGANRLARRIPPLDIYGTDEIRIG